MKNIESAKAMMHMGFTLKKLELLRAIDMLRWPMIMDFIRVRIDDERDN